MLTIRLQRTGKKNRPEFRLVLAEKASHVTKKFQEILGSYDPRTKATTLVKERIQYWLSHHASVSPTAHNMLVTQGVIEGKKVRAFNTPKKETPAEEVKAAPAAAAPVEAAPEAPAEAAAPEEAQA
jgi:small subunit ribosomal protein S16